MGCYLTKQARAARASQYFRFSQCNRKALFTDCISSYVRIFVRFYNYFPCEIYKYGKSEYRYLSRGPKLFIMSVSHWSKVGGSSCLHSFIILFEIIFVITYQSICRVYGRLFKYIALFQKPESSSIALMPLGYVICYMFISC